MMGGRVLVGACGRAAASLAAVRCFHPSLAVEGGRHVKNQPTLSWKLRRRLEEESEAIRQQERSMVDGADEDDANSEEQDGKVIYKQKRKHIQVGQLFQRRPAVETQEAQVSGSGSR